MSVIVLIKNQFSRVRGRPLFVGCQPQITPHNSQNPQCNEALTSDTLRFVYDALFWFGLVLLFSPKRSTKFHCRLAIRGEGGGAEEMYVRMCYRVYHLLCIVILNAFLHLTCAPFAVTGRKRYRMWCPGEVSVESVGDSFPSK